MSSTEIRKGTKHDIPAVFELVKELALYEKAPEQVTNSIERMIEDGFGDNPIYDLFVAEKNGRIIGTSIFYYRYSTWKGKRLYLEDIIVTEAERGQGAGQLLFDATVQFAHQNNCTGMMWQALDWNKPALDFYAKYNTTFDSEWINCHLDF